MEWINILRTLGFWGIAVAGGAYVLQRLFGQWLSQDLAAYKAELKGRYDCEIERLRADLRAAAFERETRFARLHERRAGVIDQLYKYLVSAHGSFAEMVSVLQIGDEEHRRKRVMTGGDNANKFFAYFHENDIYFDPALCELIEQLETKIRRTWADFTVFPDLKPATGGEWHDIWKGFSADVPPLKREIQDRFRRLLGVEPNNQL